MTHSHPHPPVAPLPAVAVYSTLAADAIARFVQAAYGCAEVTRCWLARRGFNDVYELGFASGERCIARLNGLRARGGPNIDYETALLRHLRDGGAPVAAPWATPHGATHVPVLAVEGQRTLAVFEYLEGDAPGQDLRDIEATGAGLARLHDLARDFDGPASRYALDLQHLLARPLDRLLQAPTMDGQLRSDFSALAARLEARVSAMPALSQVACHGDCHGGNNFMRDAPDGTRTAWFFDFDDAGPGFLAYDLAVFLWAALVGKPALDAAASERWSRYLAGYAAVRPIPAADRDAIAAFVPVRHVWLLGEYAGRLAQQGAEALPRQWLRKQVELLHAWEALERVS